MALLATSVSELRSSSLLQSTTNQSSPLSIAAAQRPVLLETGLSVPCWTKKGGCHCRCHSKTSTSPIETRYVFIEVQGWQAFGKTCNVKKCNARFLSLQIRLTASRVWIPWAINIALRLDAISAVPRITFTPSRVCKYTSPGFVELEKIRWEHGVPLEESVASFKALFSSGQASHTDVSPKGDGYLDFVLRFPWPSRLQKAQWDLVKFLIVEAPKHILRNPRLLYYCASWIYQGPHMSMLATLLSFGLDPGLLDPSLFFNWPRASDLIHSGESSPDDPMFIEFFRACLQRQPGDLHSCH